MASAGLRDDSGYVDYWNRRSQAPLQYFMGFQAGKPPADIQGKPVVGAGSDRVGVDRAFRYTRVETMPAEHRLETPLYGTAPFRATGDGVLVHTDVSTRLQIGDRMGARGREQLAEVNLEHLRRQFVGAVPRVEDAMRAGANTRAPPVYGAYPATR